MESLIVLTMSHRIPEVIFPTIPVVSPSEPFEVSLLYQISYSRFRLAVDLSSSYARTLHVKQKPSAARGAKFSFRSEPLASSDPSLVPVFLTNKTFGKNPCVIDSYSKRYAFNDTCSGQRDDLEPRPLGSCDGKGAIG